MNVKAFLFCLIVVLFFVAPPSQASGVAVFAARNHLKVHDEVLQGFRSVCPAQVREFDVPEEDLDGLKKKVVAFDPVLILAIGSDAFAASLKVGGVPVVFALVLKENNAPHHRMPVTGVDLLLSPRRQLEAVHSVLPRAKRIGVIYNPAETGSVFSAVREAASSLGLTIVGRKAESTAGAIRAIKMLDGKIDALWLLPDASILDYETVKYAMLFSFENRVPVIAPSEDFVKNGALIGLGVDAFDMGVQAGRIADDILSGKSARDIPVEFARKLVLSVNVETAKRFGIRIPASVLKRSLLYGAGQ